MGQVAIVTIGLNSYSVYALTTNAVTDATTYFGGQLGGSSAAWAAASSDDKKRGLIMAARWIDRAIKFSGTKTVPSQALEWPRDGATCDGEAVPNGSVPDDVALAEFELAGILLQDPTKAAAPSQGSNVKAVKAGSAGVEFFTPTIGTSQDTRLPTVANDLLKCFFGGSVQAGFASGVDGEVEFCHDDFDRTEGFA